MHGKTFTKYIIGQPTYSNIKCNEKCYASTDRELTYTKINDNYEIHASMSEDNWEFRYSRIYIISVFKNEKLYCNLEVDEESYYQFIFTTNDIIKYLKKSTNGDKILSIKRKHFE